ncbi:MAG TPA: TerB family tellurite resistance protein [Candidatus Sumerlaeota bacterium]|nr:TerB family tellurite resistance protein [Candidatus Sumerlaeota bacterium]HNM46496.1 TerB family tellurite resistance protein [Candidatus Sumerlaeota bacterium]
MQSGNNEKICEGLLLSMMLVASMDETPSTEETREIALIAAEEPEFAGLDDGQVDSLLAKVQADLHKKPDDLFATIKRLLPSDKVRERGLELAVRIVTADGIVSDENTIVLEKFRKQFGVSQDRLDDFIIAAQRRLVRFMMIYLVYLTAIVDKKISAKELELMTPLVITLPAFKGVSADQFNFISKSVRRHLDLMKKDWGIDYITSTLRNAAELLADDSIPEQACRLVARGIFADGKVADKERDFFETICTKLGLPSHRSSEFINKSVVTKK